MNLPITGNVALVLAIVFGFVFGWLLHRGGVANYNVIVNQFRLRDFTVLKVMFTAIVAGGIGVSVLNQLRLVHEYDIKDANMLGVILGSAIFGVGMVLYGYCPGTGIAAAATGSVHALVGFAGMLVGGVLYAATFKWVSANILSVWALGKVRLIDSGIPEAVWLALLVVVAAAVFWVIEKKVEPAAGKAG